MLEVLFLASDNPLMWEATVALSLGQVIGGAGRGQVRVECTHLDGKVHWDVCF